MAGMNPRSSFPAFQVTQVGGSALTNTASSVVIPIPGASSGNIPSYCLVSCFQVSSSPSAAAAHFRVAPTATAATCTTGDTIVSSNQGIWINTLGMHAIAALGVTGNVRVQVSPIEEGAIRPPQGSKDTAGMG